jgi:hypothetical protein
VFGVTGALWLYERHWLGWVGLAFLCSEALLLCLFRRWSRADAALLPHPPAILPPTFAPRDEAAWALVQEYLARIDRGEIVFEALTVLVARLEILEAEAAHYNPRREPLFAVQVPLLWAIETAHDLAQATAIFGPSHHYWGCGPWLSPTTKLCRRTMFIVAVSSSTGRMHSFNS